MKHTNSSGDPGSFIPLLLSVLPVSVTKPNEYSLINKNMLKLFFLDRNYFFL